jgi:Icc-related predicted phosphoesterase
MPVSRVRILQIGDMHFPAAQTSRRNIDDKDNRFSSDLKGIISSSPIKLVMQKCYELMEVGKVQALVLMGDLTDRGNLDGYQSAVRFLVEALQVGTGRKHEKTPCIIVPGNHDINRDLASSPSLIDKFTPLNTCLSKQGLAPFPIDGLLKTKIPGYDTFLDLISLNSCWGCGVKEIIPEPFRTEIYAAVDAVARKSDAGLLAYYERQLDSPAFSDQTVQKTLDALADEAGGQLPILIAHHNLLPQRITRLAPYTELINSGAIRSALLEANRPCLYLHGHIHDDPIEVMKIPGGQNLISICAPELERGFNVIDLAFSASGFPLSCTVEQWRFNRSGHLQKAKSQRVSLLTGRRRAELTATGEILAHVLSKKMVYLTDLEEFARSKSPPLEREGLLEELEMLSAEDLVTIENERMGPAHWIVRSMI